jgi:hypothetical protein
MCRVFDKQTTQVNVEAETDMPVGSIRLSFRLHGPFWRVSDVMRRIDIAAFHGQAYLQACGRDGWIIWSYCMLITGTPETIRKCENILAEHCA